MTHKFANQLGMICLALALSGQQVLADDYLKQCQSSGNYWHQCIAQREADVLSQIFRRAERLGDQLILKPTNDFSPNKVLVDGQYSYRVKQHFPDKRITLISATTWEWSTAYAYFHNSGSLKEIYGDVQFSADGRHMVAYNTGINEGFSQTAVAVFSLTGYPRLLSSFLNSKFDVIEAEFTSNDKIMLKTYYFTDAIEDGALGASCVLEHKADIWQFRELSCAGGSE